MKITFEITPEEVTDWNTINYEEMRLVPDLIRHILSGFSEKHENIYIDSESVSEKLIKGE
jgi:hypothetical protein